MSSTGAITPAHPAWLVDRSCGCGRAFATAAAALVVAAAVSPRLVDTR